MFVMKELLEEDEIEEWYFKLHFYNFLEDLKECLANVGRWTEKDREEFLHDLKEACQLLEIGFEYITDMDGTKLFRKRK
jgi:hypothetical protein